jgi:hypothetical protein
MVWDAQVINKSYRNQIISNLNDHRAVTTMTVSQHLILYNAEIHNGLLVCIPNCPVFKLLAKENIPAHYSTRTVRDQ